MVFWRSKERESLPRKYRIPGAALSVTAFALGMYNYTDIDSGQELVQTTAVVVGAPFVLYRCARDGLLREKKQSSLIGEQNRSNADGISKGVIALCAAAAAIPFIASLEEARSANIADRQSTTTSAADLEQEASVTNELDLSCQISTTPPYDEESVRILQSWLRVYAPQPYPFQPDGEYGEITADSVRSFQEAEGLAVTGTWDDESCFATVEYDYSLANLIEN